MNEQPGFSHPTEAQILARIPEAVRDRARAVRMMVFDVDGILTDGSLWYGEHGEAVKPFNALDGHGLRLLREQGIRVAWVSGRKSAITARRAAELGISPVLQGVRDKITTAPEIKGAALVNVLASYKLGKGDLSIGIENLFDTTYMNPTASATRNNVVNGFGRTVSLGYKVTF